MPYFSPQSIKRLSECHPDLRALFNEVVKEFDCTIMCGHRGKEEQDRAFDSGASKLKFPNSNHNKEPSLAVDVLPYPADYKDIKEICFFAGYVMKTAKVMKDNGIINIGLRWGADWDRDYNIKEHKFFDGAHFEVVV